MAPDESGNCGAPMRSTGIHIAVEGLDGAGKSTLIERIGRELAAEFEQAARGAEVSPAAALRWRTFSSVVTGTYEFILELISSGIL